MQTRFSRFIARIPHKRLARLGKLLGLLIYAMDARHRRIVRRNLAFAYPDWSAEQVNKTAGHVFRNLGMTILEICQMACLSSQDILKKVNIRGEGHLKDALQKRKGVIFISAHIGNWEIVPQFWPLYFHLPIIVVARQLQNKIINQWIYALRTRFGSRVIDKDVAMPEMTRTLRQGNMLAVLIDQGVKSSLGVKITFFDKFVTATSGAALLAKRCDSPVLPGCCIRNNDGTFTVHLEPPLALQKTRNLREDLTANTQIMTDAIEKMVRAYPEHWFWLHKRWRKYYPHLYPEDMARRRRRRIKKNRNRTRMP